MNFRGDAEPGVPAERPCHAEAREAQDRLDCKLGAALQRLSEQVDRARDLLAALEPASGRRGREPGDRSGDQRLEG